MLWLFVVCGIQWKLQRTKTVTHPNILVSNQISGIITQIAFLLPVQNISDVFEPCDVESDFWLWSLRRFSGFLTPQDEFLDFCPDTLLV